MWHRCLGPRIWPYPSDFHPPSFERRTCIAPLSANFFKQLQVGRRKKRTICLAQQLGTTSGTKSCFSSKGNRQPADGIDLLVLASRGRSKKKKAGRSQEMVHKRAGQSNSCCAWPVQSPIQGSNKTQIPCSNCSVRGLPRSNCRQWEDNGLGSKEGIKAREQRSHCFVLQCQHSRHSESFATVPTANHVNFLGEKQWQSFFIRT